LSNYTLTNFEGLFRSTEFILSTIVAFAAAVPVTGDRWAATIVVVEIGGDGFSHLQADDVASQVAVETLTNIDSEKH